MADGALKLHPALGSQPTTLSPTPASRWGSLCASLVCTPALRRNPSRRGHPYFSPPRWPMQPTLMAPRLNSAISLLNTLQPSVRSPTCQPPPVARIYSKPWTVESLLSPPFTGTAGCLDKEPGKKKLHVSHAANIMLCKQQLRGTHANGFSARHRNRCLSTPCRFCSLGLDSVEHAPLQCPANTLGRNRWHQRSRGGRCIRLTPCSVQKMP